MFGKKPQATAVAPPPPVDRGPQPSEVLVGLTKDELSTYEETAKALGLEEAPAIVEERLRHFLSENAIHIYDHDKVRRYLNDHLDRNGWGWVPLRPVDVGKVERTGGTVGYRESDNIFNDRGYYAEAVPGPVLETALLISKAFPNVHFFVSDEDRVRATGDPFLAIIIRGRTPVIVERWDEPGFRE